MPNAANNTVRARNSVDAELRTRVHAAVETGGGRARVVAKSGIAEGTLNNILGGQEIKRPQLVALADTCGVTIEWLATGRPPMRSEESTAKTVSHHPAHASIQHGVANTQPTAIVGYIGLPKYEALAATGQPSLSGNPQLVGSILFKRDWIRDRLRRNPDHMLLIEARGDSMDPQIRDGDLLLVDISPELRDGTGLYVVGVGDNLLVKRLDRRIDGSVVLTSDNPRYQPETVPPSLVEQLRIIGQVVWQGGPVRS